MYEVTQDILEVTSKKTGEKHLVPIYSRAVDDGGSLYKVTAGTDGTMDGDSEDTRTIIDICNPIGFGLFKAVKDADGNGCGVEITAVGDDDLRALIKALKFATKVLEEEAEEIDD